MGYMSTPEVISKSGILVVLLQIIDISVSESKGARQTPRTGYVR